MKKDALLKVIADRLITLRLSAGKISQRELARQTSLSPGTINRIENCKEFPQKDTLRIIARFFGTRKHPPSGEGQGGVLLENVRYRANNKTGGATHGE